MQLDRPSKRRPRPPNRPPNPQEGSERRQSSDTRTDQHAGNQQGDPFQIQKGPDPFRQRSLTTPSRPKSSRVVASFSTGPSSAPAPDPFQPLPLQSGFGTSRGPAQQGSLGGKDSTFGQNITFGQTSFGQDASSFSQTVAALGQESTPFVQSTSSFPKNPTAFGQKPISLGQNVTSFGQSRSSFAPNPTPFSQHLDPFDQSTKSLSNNLSSFAPSSEQSQQIRTPTRRRLRSVPFAKSSPERRPSTLFRGAEDGDADLERGQYSDALLSTPEIGTKKHQSARPNQLLLKSVPLPLFSRAALQRHFSSIPGVHVTYVSLRGSKRPDSRRTALISFSTDKDASLALRNGQTFKGADLQLFLFRQNTQVHEQAANEPNELFFNYVPESLFSEESIKDLFDSISEKAVTKVSLKERPHYGSVKRTAIITFSSAKAATTALRSLPLYNGRPLTVSFRRTSTRPQSNNGTTVAVGTHGASEHASRKYPDPNETQEDDELEEDVDINLQDEYAVSKGTDYGDAPVNDDVDLTQEDFDNDSEAEAKPQLIDKQAEIARLKAAIVKKEKERSRMAQGRDKREKKLMVPQQRDTLKHEQELKESGWRKVGEKVDIKNAASFVGTCMTMCPAKEFEDRIIQRDVSVFETNDGTSPSFKKAVKKYRRSAAISEQPSPDEVRPPSVLLETMDHLKEISDSTDATFADVHNFVRDRTRSLRQDYTLQGVHDESCIRIHEESVRFHILSEHRLHGTDPAVFSSKQNREQLDKCLISLREMYDLRRENGLDTSPNEPEMQAYYILTQMSDPKTCVQLCTGFAQDVRCSQPVQFALEVVRAASESFGNFTRYFSLVRSAPYLVACLMHSHFTIVRVRALAVINVTHGNPNSKDNMPVSAVARQLGFENDKEAEEFCRTLGMQIEVATLPSLGPDVITIRTPSEGFDEAKASAWEASRADILVESKAKDFKTSEIITGRGRNDFKTGSPAKEISKKVKTKKIKSPLKTTRQPLSLVPRVSGVPTNLTDLAVFGSSVFAPNINSAPQSEPVIETKQSPTTEIANSTKPTKKLRTADDPFQKQHIPFISRTIPTIQTERRTFQTTPKLLDSTPIVSYVPTPMSRPTPPSRDNKTKINTGPVLHGPPSKPQAKPLPIIATAGVSVPLSPLKTEREETAKKLQSPVVSKLQVKINVPSGKPASPTCKPDDQPTSLELQQVARAAALQKLLVGLVEACERDLANIRMIIGDAQTGKLKFPKAMEVWDDAKDILLAVSERSERGLQEVENESSLRHAPTQGADTEIEEMRDRLRFSSHEGTELLDQLEETFSKALAATTAHLQDRTFHHSWPKDSSQVIGTLDRLNTFTVQGAVDEDVPFQVHELPDRGAEVQSILHTMTTAGLHRWQAVITDLASVSPDGNEIGIAQRWLRQRLSTSAEVGSGPLCLVDAKQCGTPSISIREIREVSRIPYTADLIIVSCDVRTMTSEPSSAWASLEDVLMNNRSIASSYDLPAPMVVVLYYCGSSDIPSWWTDQKSAGNTFSAFQNALQDNNYVASCQRVELPRTIASQGMKFDPFISAMKTSVRSVAESFERMGITPRVTDLRDHLVHVANCALGAVLESNSSQVDAEVSARAIHEINASWEDVALRLRREENRWPEELAERRRIANGYTYIKCNLYLPEPRNESLVADYVRDFASVAGVGIPAVQHLDGALSFCTALGHLMNAFVQRKMLECPTITVYLPPESRYESRLRKLKPISKYLAKPVNSQMREERSSSKYVPRTEPQRKTKRLRDETSPNDDTKRARYPLRRRLSVFSSHPDRKEQSTEFIPNRRRSLPASYGRRRMFEVYDEICTEEQAFDDFIQATMDALTAKRRRLEQRAAPMAV